MDIKKHWKEAVECPWNKKFPETETELSVRDQDGKRLISFMYSSGDFHSTDWKHNFDFLKVPYKEMPKKFLVHRGFLKKYKEIREEVLYYAGNALEMGLDIELRGFSQGGALAVLAHEDLRFHGYEPNTITFGAPMVFGFLSQKVLKKRLGGLRMVMVGRDVVTWLPGWLFGYRHFWGILRKLKGKYPVWQIENNHLSYREY